MFKVQNHICKLRISLKRLPKCRRIGLLRHAYQQNGGLR